MRSVLLFVLIPLGVAAAGLAVGVRGALAPHTPTFTDDAGNPIPEGVAELTAIELGGLKQYILMRGTDRTNPVLLWLHGGPGAAQMPLAHALDGELEEAFVVVHWDQRGAGRSNHGGFDERTMTLDQYVDDAHELIGHLQHQFDQDRVFLLGHSWGSQLGIEVAARYPEDVHAFIGVSQVVDNHEAYEIAYGWIPSMIRREGPEEDRARLKELGRPPYTEHGDHVAFTRLVGDYGGNFDVGMGTLARIALRAPEYGLWDYVRWLRGANRGSGAMWDEIYARGFDYRSEIPSLDVPVYLFAGKKDYNTPHRLIVAYHAALEAPHKELVTFERSAHTPFLAEPAAFSRAVIRIGRSHR